MSENLNGIRAVKVPAGPLSNDESRNLFSKEGYIYWNALSFCQSHIEELAATKNIDILEYQAMLNQNCHKFEKMFYGALRMKMREKIYNDQIKEFSNSYDRIFHPYNPYLQKYNGAYLRSYQLFD
jgi:hypothetical protein